MASAYDLTPSLAPIYADHRNLKTNISGQIEAAGDLDWYRFDLGSDSGIKIGSSGGPHAAIQLVDAAGNPLVGEFINSNFASPVMPAGSYFVKVSSDHVDYTPTYNLSVTVMPAVNLTDLVTADPLRPGVVTASWDETIPQGMSSYFTLDLEAGKLFDFEGVDQYWLLKPVGSDTAYNQQKNELGDLLVQYTDRYWYHTKASSFSSAQLHMDVFVIDLIPEAEPNDTGVEATVVTAAQFGQMPGNMQRKRAYLHSEQGDVNDVDYFQITVEQGDYYWFSSEIEAAFYTDGSPVAWGTGGGGVHSWGPAPATQNILLRMSQKSVGEGAVGYVEQRTLNEVESNNDRATAQNALPLLTDYGDLLAGHLVGNGDEYPTRDYDYYRLSLQAGDAVYYERIYGSNEIAALDADEVWMPGYNYPWFIAPQAGDYYIYSTQNNASPYDIYVAIQPATDLNALFSANPDDPAEQVADLPGWTRYAGDPVETFKVDVASPSYFTFTGTDANILTQNWTAATRSSGVLLPGTYYFHRDQGGNAAFTLVPAEDVTLQVQDLGGGRHSLELVRTHTARNTDLYAFTLATDQLITSLALNVNTSANKAHVLYNSAGVQVSGAYLPAGTYYLQASVYGPATYTLTLNTIEAVDINPELITWPTDATRREVLKQARNAGGTPQLYKITLSDKSFVWAELRSPSDATLPYGGMLGLRVYAADRSYVVGDSSYGKNLVQQFLGAGDYYFELPAADVDFFLMLDDIVPVDEIEPNGGLTNPQIVDAFFRQVHPGIDHGFFSGRVATGADSFGFDLQAGDLVYLKLFSSIAIPKIKLYDPSGQVVAYAWGGSKDFTHQAETAGRYVVIVNENTSGTDDFVLDLWKYATDETEPNDSVGTAMDLTGLFQVSAADSRVREANLVVGLHRTYPNNSSSSQVDYDYYKVHLEAGDLLTVTSTGPDYSGKLWNLLNGVSRIAVHDATGTELYAKNGAIAPATLLNQWAALATGDYFVRMDRGSYSYALSLLEMRFEVRHPDEVEPNDSLANATHMNPLLVTDTDGMQTGQFVASIGTPGDHDYFRIDITDPGTIDIRGRKVDGNDAINSQILDASGSPVRTSSSLNHPNFSLNTPGTYYLHTWAQSASETYAYTFDMIYDPAVPDSHEPNDTLAQAANLTASLGPVDAHGDRSVTVTGNNLHLANDLDVYAIDVNAGDVLQATLPYQSTLRAQWLTPDGDWLPYLTGVNGAGGVETVIRSTAVAPKDGTHYLVVYTTQGSLTTDIDYDLTLHVGVPTASDDVLSSGGAQLNQAQFTGTQSLTGTPDFYKLWLNAGQVVTANGDEALLIADVAPSSRVQTASGPTTIVTSGYYYLIPYFNASWTENYSLTLTITDPALSEVEPNDSQATAQPLPVLPTFSRPVLVQSVAGEIDTGGAQDWYSFKLSSGAEIKALLGSTAGAGTFRATILDPNDNVWLEIGSGGNYHDLSAATASLTGTYVARIEGTDGAQTGSYHFSIVRHNSESEPNDSLAGATDLSPLITDALAMGVIPKLAATSVPGSDPDLYRLSFSQPVMINAGTDNHQGKGEVPIARLLDASGNLLFGGDTSNIALQPGVTYYLDTSSSGLRYYELSVQVYPMEAITFETDPTHGGWLKADLTHNYVNGQNFAGFLVEPPDGHVLLQQVTSPSTGYVAVYSQNGTTLLSGAALSHFASVDGQPVRVTLIEKQLQPATITATLYAIPVAALSMNQPNPNVVYASGQFEGVVGDGQPVTGFSFEVAQGASYRLTAPSTAAQFKLYRPDGQYTTATAGNMAGTYIGYWYYDGAATTVSADVVIASPIEVEPNNTPAQANSLDALWAPDADLPGVERITAIGGEINGSSDFDWYSTSLIVDDILRAFALHPQFGDGFSAAIFDPAGQQVGTNSVIAEADGLYTIRIGRDFRTGTYEFRALRSHSDEQATEPNDSLVDATDIDALVTATGEPDRVRSGYVRGYGADVLSITLQEDQVLAITSRSMSILASDGVGVGFHAFDSFGQPILNASEVLYQDMTWYLAANRTGAYSISVGDVPGYVLELQVYETQDLSPQLLNADHRDLTITSSLTDQSHPQFYRFSSPGDETVFAQVTPNVSQSTPQIDLLDRSGRSWRSWQPIYAWIEGEVSGYAISPGDYYIAVFADSADQVGSFDLTLQIDRVEPLAGNDTPAMATNIDGAFAPYGGPTNSTYAEIQGMMSGATDRDYYAITLEEGQAITFRVLDINYFDQTANGVFYYSVSGMGHTLVNEFDYLSTTRTAVAPQTGTYYIDARGNLADAFRYKFEIYQHRGYVLDETNVVVDPVTGDQTWHIDFDETLGKPEAGFSIHHGEHVLIHQTLNGSGGGTTEGPYDVAGNEVFYLDVNNSVSTDVRVQTAIASDSALIDEGSFAYANLEATVYPGRTTWFHFDVQAGATVDLDLVMPFATSPGLSVRGLDWNFTEQNRTPEPGYAVAKSVIAGQDGTLYVGVHSQDTAPIDILLHVGLGDAQEVEPNDSFATAQDVASVDPFHPHDDPNATGVWVSHVSGTLAVEGDIDYWRIEAQAGEALIVGAPGNNQVDLAIYGPDQTLRGLNPYETGAVVAIPITVTGTYYVRVSMHRFDTAPGPYQLTLHRYATEDWDPLLVDDNGTQTYQDDRNPEFALDVPVFSVTLAPGDLVSIGKSNGYAMLWDSQGHIVGQSLNGALTNVPTWASGSYYGVGFDVSSTSSLNANGRGNSLSIVSAPSLFETEPNDSVPQADAFDSLMVPDDENPQVQRAAIYGHAEPGQLDYFSVQLQVGDVIQLDTDVSEQIGSPGDVSIELLAPDGSLVMSDNRGNEFTDMYYVLRAGAYTVRVTGHVTGNYLLRASVNPASAATLIDIGYGEEFSTKINGIYLRDSSTLRFDIDALKGDQLILNPATNVFFGSQHQPQMFVYDENHQLVSWFSGPRDDGDPNFKRIIAPHDGRYHIIIGRTTALNNYTTLKVRREAPVARPLQVAYLNFDGGFVGNDPVVGVDLGTLNPLDASIYNLTDRDALIDTILVKVEDDFPGMAVRITPHRPEWGDYTQVYIAGNSSASVGLSGYSIAQRIDDTNFYQNDVAYVFGPEFVVNVPGAPAADVRTIADPAERLDVVATMMANEISRQLGFLFGAYRVDEAPSLMGPDGHDLYPDQAFFDSDARLNQTTAFQNSHDAVARNLGLFTPGYRIEMPNDTPAQAMALNTEEAAASTVVWAGTSSSDPDYFKINLVSGQPLTVSTATETFSGSAMFQSTSLLDPGLLLYDPTGNLIASDSNSAGDGINALLDYTAAVTGIYTIQVIAESGEGEYFLTSQVSEANATVVSRHIFYNGSAFDGDTGASAADDNAIAIDKTALLPGQTASFANYTSYSRGINGIIVDIQKLGAPGSLSAADFVFKVGNDDNPDNWATAPAPVSVTVRIGEGAGGSDRVTLIWADNAIQKQWLQVTVLASANTGLTADDVFYFGNAIGDTGNSTTDTAVNVTDMLGARNNPHNLSAPAPVVDVYDFNRDRLVDVTDMLIARNNTTNLSTDLNLITAPAVATAPLFAAAPVIETASMLTMTTSQPEVQKTQTVKLVTTSVEQETQVTDKSSPAQPVTEPGHSAGRIALRASLNYLLAWQQWCLRIRPVDELLSSASENRGINPQSLLDRV